MTALIIIGAIVLFFVLIGLIRVSVSLRASEDTTLTLKVLFLKFVLYPKGPPDPKKFTKKALEKQAKKDAKKKKKKNKDESVPPSDGETKEPFKNKLDRVKDIVGLVLAILEKTARPFGRYLVVKTRRLWIVVGSDDAAKTAITYGYVSQAVCYICEILDHLTNFKKQDGDSVCVGADFVSGKTRFDLDIALSIRIWQAAALGIRALGAFIKYKLKQMKKESVSENRKETADGKL